MCGKLCHYELTKANAHGANKGFDHGAMYVYVFYNLLFCGGLAKVDFIDIIPGNFTGSDTIIRS